MATPADQRLVIDLKLGATRGASFAGDPKAVLMGLCMVLVFLLGAAYLALQTKHQITDPAGKLIMRTLNHGDDHAGY